MIAPSVYLSPWLLVYDLVVVLGARLKGGEKQERNAVGQWWCGTVTLAAVLAAH